MRRVQIPIDHRVGGLGDSNIQAFVLSVGARFVSSPLRS